MNTGVSENCSLIRRGGREQPGPAGCVEGHPHTFLGMKPLCASWAESGVRTEGSRAEGGEPLGGGRAGAWLWASQGQTGRWPRGPPSTPSPRRMATGGCVVRAALSRALHVCSRECAQGALPHPLLTPSGWEQRLHSGGRGGGLTTPGPLGAAGHPGSHSDCRALHAHGLVFKPAFPATLLLPFVQLWEKEGAWDWGLWVSSVPSWALSSFGGCLSPR